MGSDEKDETKNILGTIFSEPVVTIILWVLAIYYILTSVRDVTSSDGKNTRTKVINLIITFGIFVLILNKYYNLGEDERDNLVSYLTENAKANIQNADLYLSSAAVWLFYLVVIYMFTYIIKYISGDITVPSAMNTLLTLVSIPLIMYIVLFIVVKIFRIPVVDILQGFFKSTDSASDDKDGETEDTSNKPKEEVYNIFNNLYTYDEAPYVCKTFGGRLATYDEVEQAYRNGAEWCNYGWSAGQMTLFPTQTETWNELQTNPDFKNACGRPGINGGYIDNPNVKYGVNCYGVKPVPTAMEQSMMDAKSTALLPRSAEQLKMDRKVEFWKQNADKLLNINSFNKDEWSRY